MHIVTDHSPRLSQEAPPQAPQKPPCARKTSPVRLVRRFISCLCAGGVLGAALALCPAASAQSQVAYQGSPQTTPSASPTGSQMDSNADTAFRKMTEKMARQRNTDRQKKIMADTAKLLAMAQKLNDEVSHSSKNELSIDVVEQAGQIEKLAKSIKDKMRDGY